MFTLRLDKVYEHTIAANMITFRLPTVDTSTTIPCIMEVHYILSQITYSDSFDVITDMHSIHLIFRNLRCGKESIIHKDIHLVPQIVLHAYIPLRLIPETASVQVAMSENKNSIFHTFNYTTICNCHFSHPPRHIHHSDPDNPSD